jgi:flagellar protein FlbD
VAFSPRRFRSATYVLSEDDTFARGTVSAMIKLTRLDGEAFVLNAELIRYVETRPDTFITLTTNERLVVRESMDEVVHLAIDYQRSKHLFPVAS